MKSTINTKKRIDDKRKATGKDLESVGKKNPRQPSSSGSRVIIKADSKEKREEATKFLMSKTGLAKAVSKHPIGIKEALALPSKDKTTDGLATYKESHKYPKDVDKKIPTTELKGGQPSRISQKLVDFPYSKTSLPKKPEFTGNLNLVINIL